jgi:hypothetical protein
MLPAADRRAKAYRHESGGTCELAADLDEIPHWPTREAIAKALAGTWRSRSRGVTRSAPHRRRGVHASRRLPPAMPRTMQTSGDRATAEEHAAERSPVPSCAPALSKLPSV